MVDIYIRTQGADYGPYSQTELRAHLKAGRIPFSAWLHLDGKWQLLAENAELRESHPDYESMPEDAPTKSSASELPVASKVAMSSGTGAIAGSVSAEPVWFFVRDKKKFGPYSAAELVGQLQRKQLEASTYVWRPGFATWQKMSQVNEFSRDAMRRLASDGAPVEILVKRKFTRAPYEVEVVAHDNTRAIQGRSMVIGEGGLFLATERPSHRVGARLKLHFREGEAAAFNAVAEVVSVVRGGEMPGYCMRFVALSDSDRRRIAKLVTERK